MQTCPVEDKKPLFSILIPTWNNLGFLKLCIDSIERNSCYGHEILIHVNDGSDGTLEWVREMGYRYVHTEKNVGVCASLNGLRSLMQTDYLVYVNDDMYMCPGWDKVFYDEIMRMPDKQWFLGATRIQPHPNKRRPNSILVKDFGSDPDGFDESFFLDNYKALETNDWKGVVHPPNVVHRDIWDLVGGYSLELSPGLGSDPDFTAKLLVAGVTRLKGLGKCLCYHFESKTVGRMKTNKGSLQFLRKWGITVRAFETVVIEADESWDEPVQINERKLAIELLRSRVKKLLTVWNDVKSPSPWMQS